MTKFSEIAINGKPIDWAYWVNKKLTPHEAACLANRVDPINFKNIELNREIIRNIDLIARDLQEQQPISLPQLCDYLDDSAPLGLQQILNEQVIQDTVDLHEPLKANSNPEGSLLETINDQSQLKSQRQLAAIELVIRNKNWFDSGIPTGNKITIKEICESDYPDLFDGQTSFENAWKTRNKDKLRMTYHASFSHRGR